MQQLSEWIRRAAPSGQRPLMVAFNAPYDWAFINHYFLEYLGENPFGHSAIDIKAFYMGLIGCPWRRPPCCTSPLAFSKDSSFRMML